MKRFLKFLAAGFVFLLFAAVLTPTHVQAANGRDMYRLYNWHSGEHFYTANAAERNHLMVVGWNYEGIGWTAPASGRPVYRLYNPNAGDHHYTMKAAERNMLMSRGWKYEGVGWYSGGSVPIYREYNPHAKTGTHHYTPNKAENDMLVRAGWRAEGIGWYGLPDSRKSNAGNVADGTYEASLTRSRYTEFGDVRAGYVMDASRRGNTLVVDGAFKYSSGITDYIENGSIKAYGEYVFPFDSSTVFYLSGGDDPADIVSASEFMRVIHRYNGLGLQLWVKNGIVISANISS